MPVMRTLIPFIKKFQQSSVFVVGDVMLDVFVYGEIVRISPEAPVPILRIISQKEMVGGAGNVVRNLLSLGCKVFFAGVTGNDEHGQKISDLFSTFSELEFHLEKSFQPTIVKTRYISNNQQVLRTDAEERFELSKKSEDTIVNHLIKHIKNLNIIIISDYNKGTITETLAQRIISIGAVNNIPTFVDPKGKDYQKYKNATLIKPNKKELMECFNNEKIDGNEVLYLKMLRELVQSRYCILTLGKEGMVFCSESDVFKVESQKKHVFDVSGAGDTVIATLAAAVGCGTPLTDAVHLANIAAGIVVGKPETAVVTPDELLYEVNIVRRIYEHSALLDLVDYWRRDRCVIGFTNGCFDLLHQGHISLLKFAKSNCDKLIVALNSDKSVQALKGPLRPIKNDKERALIMSEFNSVDAVIIFDELTPEFMIETIKPDVLIKGADYKREQIVGARIVESYGGKVLTSEYLEGFSSSNLVKVVLSGGHV
jgi:D-beta-D-heptose 7-phosphate kinase/D-beta-D-heptose 1-phosphate adenosyltransferase